MRPTGAPKVSEETVQAVLKAFQDLPGKPLERQFLCDRLLMPDRKVRAAINALVLRGHPIISSSQHSGYWYCTDPAWVRRAAQEIKHRMAEEGARVEALERWASEEELRRSGQDLPGLLQA